MIKVSYYLQGVLSEIVFCNLPYRLHANAFTGF